MLVLMPYEDFASCVRVMDAWTLRMQATAIRGVLGAVEGKRPGWDRHSLCKMWSDNVAALAVYGIYTSNELQARNAGVGGTRAVIVQDYPGIEDWAPEMPDWVGCLDIHISHRAFLLAQRPNHYEERFPNLTPSVELAWPE